MKEKCSIAESEVFALLRDKAGNWLYFKNPIRILETLHISEVLQILEEIEEIVRTGKWYAVGWIAYEASSAFDSAFSAKEGNHFPLVWFGIFSPPEKCAFFPLKISEGYSLEPWTSGWSKSQYSHAVNQIRTFIQNGETYQVNFTFKLQSQLTGNPLAWFWDLVRAHRPKYPAFFQTEKWIVCSASPELFFRLDGEKIISKPMKGTIARGRTFEEDKIRASTLWHSPKDRAENLMIVDMVRNDIGRIARFGTVRVNALYEVEKYPRVWQMTSTIAGETKASLVKIFQALFPPASITGAPKPRTTEIIASLEPGPRGVYCGAIGYLAPRRKAQFNVAIRTAVIHRDTRKVEYGTGGGIVWDSHPEKEYEECLLKADIVFKKEPEFSLLETLLWTPKEGYFLLDLHFQRLLSSAQYFDFPIDEKKWRDALEKEARTFESVAHRVRLVISEQGIPSVESIPLSSLKSRSPLRLCLAKDPVDSSNRFLYHKTTFRKFYEEKLDGLPDCDDVILWNERQEVTETTIGNIVIEWKGKYITPPVECGLLPGTFRAWLLQRGEIEEQVISFEMLQKASAIYRINAVRKWERGILFS